MAPILASKEPPSNNRAYENAISTFHCLFGTSPAMLSRLWAENNSAKHTGSHKDTMSQYTYIYIYIYIYIYLFTEN